MVQTANLHSLPYQPTDVCPYVSYIWIIKKKDFLISKIILEPNEMAVLKKDCERGWLFYFTLFYLQQMPTHRMAMPVNGPTDMFAKFM